MHIRVSKDLASGALFAATGVFFAGYAYLSLRIGTPYRMGPGFFPLVVGLILAGFGVAVMLKSLAQEFEAWGPAPVRAIVLIPLALVVFGVLARPLGLLPALLCLCLISAFASARMKPLNAAVIAVGVAATSIFIFSVLLDMSIPLFGTFFG